MNIQTKNFSQIEVGEWFLLGQDWGLCQGVYVKHDPIYMGETYRLNCTNVRNGQRLFLCDSTQVLPVNG